MYTLELHVAMMVMANLIKTSRSDTLPLSRVVYIEYQKQQIGPNEEPERDFTFNNNIYFLTRLSLIHKKLVL